ncbi:MAG: hypothetical protein WA306_07190 [Candidatus Acidiferrales bacterium]
MFSTWRLYLFVAGLVAISLLGGTASANSATLRCNSQRDQIWVYDSLATFDIAAKLKCGENVELIARVEGYVKIRAQNGVEGYVPEAAFVNLPPLETHPDPAHDVGLVAKQVQAKEIAKEAANATFPNSPDPGSSKVSRVSGSVNLVPADTTSAKKLPSSGSVGPMVGFAEIGPVPASPAVKESPSSAPVTTPADQAPVLSPTSATGISAVGTTDVITAKNTTDSTAATGDSNDIGSRELESEGRDFGCQNYFSAYGVTPNQTKWIAQNRKKLFPNVCPAPDPSKVNYVIIFTHDVDFFSATMPTPVHELNGFSDFTPVTPIDTALVSESQAEKAHREYVWVFRFAQGTFDPASFSPRRQYEFSKMEANSLGSKAGLKTVEDAFRFVAAANR